MADTGFLEDWVVEALTSHRGSATIIDVCKWIARHHDSDLRELGDVYYTWQYDVRWAAHRLRGKGVLRAAGLSPTGTWELLYKPKATS